ncbi:MAG: PDDEXK nuclease domain-containing protein [Bacteroidales bacterium]|nr:PDDEXK nuclease domain-containing protein [Bacteroidales bacterium]
MSDKPTFVSRDMMSADEGYVQWMADIKQRFRQSQVKAAVRVNTAMLEFYWSVGRDLVALRAEERWGAGVVKQFALDMRQAFPDETGFSDTNVKYMKRWYLFYYERVIKGQQAVDQIGHQAGDQFEDIEKSHQLDGQIDNPKTGQQVADQLDESEKGQQVVDQLQFPDSFGLIPWGCHILIFSKCQTLDEAIFYINKVTEEGWSRSRLESQIAANLFGSQGAAVTNFEHTLPAPQSQLAKEILKDPYHFGFLSMSEGDNPTAGLIICKSTDKTVVEWSLRDINKPLGVSTYQLEQVVERTVKELELKKRKFAKIGCVVGL